MKQMALKYFTDSDLTLLALMLFTFSFVFMLWRVYVYEPRSKFDELSQIPLKDEEGVL